MALRTSPSRPALACRGVSYVYPDGTAANRAIDLELFPGELFCLVGPNGAGKTTLIRQITTELRPSAGEVRIHDEDAHRDPVATKAQLGVIPQAATLFESLSVEEHLLLFGPLKQLTRRETAAVVPRLLATCQLAAARRKQVRELSGGQKRALMVALALMADPAILVLDEPTTGLDPVARRHLWDTIAGQRAAGKAILLTTHYMDEAERLADRLGFIDGGVLALTGTLAELSARLGKSVRVTPCDEVSGTPLAPHYFDTLAEAQSFVRTAGLRAYAVGRVSLEDIYLRLTHHESGGDTGASAA